MSAKTLKVLVVSLTTLLTACAGPGALSPVAVVWEDAGGSTENFTAHCQRCRGHVRFEALARDFESPLFRTSAAERYGRALAWGRSALATCLVDAGFAARVARVSEASSPDRICTVDGVIYP